MNHLRATVDLRIDHSGLSDLALAILLRRVAKAARGRSSRSVSVECGGVTVTIDEDGKLEQFPKK